MTDYKKLPSKQMQKGDHSCYKRDVQVIPNNVVALQVEVALTHSVTSM